MVLIPAGYAEFDVRGARVVAISTLAGAVREAMAAGTLYEYAARQRGARALEGRGITWSARLPDDTAVAVRHSRHGGTLASVTRDIFLTPTRAPHELDAALRLRAAGVQTPELVAFAVYPAFGPFVRADVATRLVDGEDFPAAWRTGTKALRDALLDATVHLLHALRAAGAEHPDLNVKNILIASGAPTVAFVLDVDRVRFGEAADPEIGRRNTARLLRSLQKWRTLRGLDVTDGQLARLAEAARSEDAGIAAGVSGRA